jgi:thiamine-monophosphate kinase
MKEFELIEKIFKPLSNKPSQNFIKFSSLDLQDDIAIINYNKTHDLIVSKDIFIENIHFLKQDGAEKIASKLLLTNISDIASSGGKPLFYLLGFTKNSSCDENFLKKFYQGLKKIQNQFNINLIGGDTSNSQTLAFSITIFGLIKKGKALLRGSAKADDLIFVSNNIGDAFLGLDIKQNFSQKYSKYYHELVDKHFYPQPRIDLANQLVNQNLSLCATDISDGLIKDLSNICKASKLNANIYLSQIPFSKSAEKYLKDNPKFSKLDLISGGDDYELIFTINPKNLAKISKISQKLNIKLTCIGEFVENKSKIKNSSKKFDVFLFKNNYHNEMEKFKKTNVIKISKKGYEHQ